MKRISAVFLAAALFVSCMSGKASQLKLWYDEPANQWTDALPLGNGRLGAMIFGTPAGERIQLNEETIWGGGPHNNVNYAAKDGLAEIRTALFEGRRSEAQALCDRYISSKGAHGMPYQTAGSLLLDFEDMEEFSDYYRELDIERAVATTVFKVDGVEYKRESFVSFPDEVVVMRLTASEKGALSFKASYSLPYRQDRITGGSAKPGSLKNSALLEISCKGDDHEGVEGKVRFTNRSLIVAEGGSVEVSPNMTFASSRWLSAEIVENARAKGYTQFNATVTYKAPDDQYSVQLFMRNITDEAVYTGSQQYPFIANFNGCCAMM